MDALAYSFYTDLGKKTIVPGFPDYLTRYDVVYGPEDYREVDYSHLVPDALIPRIPVEVNPKFDRLLGSSDDENLERQRTMLEEGLWAYAYYIAAIHYAPAMITPTEQYVHKGFIDLRLETTRNLQRSIVVINHQNDYSVHDMKTTLNRASAVLSSWLYRDFDARVENAVDCIVAYKARNLELFRQEHPWLGKLAFNFPPDRLKIRQEKRYQVKKDEEAHPEIYAIKSTLRRTADNLESTLTYGQRREEVDVYRTIMASLDVLGYDPNVGEVMLETAGRGIYGTRSIAALKSLIANV